MLHVRQKGNIKALKPRQNGCNQRDEKTDEDGFGQSGMLPSFVFRVQV